MLKAFVVVIAQSIINNCSYFSTSMLLLFDYYANNLA